MQKLELKSLMTKVITSVKISNLLHIQHNVVHFKVFRNV